MSQITLGKPWANASAPYATCGGVPRYSGGWSSTGVSTWSPGANQTVDVLATKTLAPFKESEPTCCIGPTDCKILQQEWHTQNPLTYPFNSSTGAGWLDGPPESYPHCNTTMMAESGNGGAGDCSGCWLIGENARIFYWPAPVEVKPEGTLGCPETYVAGESNTTYSTNYTATAVVTLTSDFDGGTATTATLTSPTVYMSIGVLQGRDGCHDFYGKNGGVVGGTIFPLGPRELQSAIMTFPGMTDAAASSSYADIIAHRRTEKYTDLFGVGWQTYLAKNPLNYPIVTQTVDMNPADFGRPPPYLSYYLGNLGAYCLQGDPAGVWPPGLTCDAIYDAYHTPQVRLATLARSLDPWWATCQLDFGWDPPIALTAANAPAQITLPGPKTTSAPVTSSVPALPDSAPASPCITPEPQTPKPTDSPTLPALKTSAQAQNSNPLPMESSMPDQHPGVPPSQSSGEQQPSPAASQPALVASSDPSNPFTSQESALALTNIPAVVVTIGSTVLNVQEDQPVNIGGQTLSVGGPAATVGAQVVSIGASVVVLGGSTAAFTTPTVAPVVGSGAFTAEGLALSAAQTGNVVQVFGSDGNVVATLASESTGMTEGGRVISFVSGEVVVSASSGGAATTLSLESAASDLITTANDHTYTTHTLANGVEVVDYSISLTPGGAATTLADGQGLSAGSDGKLVLGTRTTDTNSRTSNSPASFSGESPTTSHSAATQTTSESNALRLKAPIGLLLATMSSLMVL